ncbi:MAG: HAMP domain-containing protein [Spirulinaceae cyanobacterium RM2_2_10]|nr:HAMP domain-containing protein [Spirulinaceae cyanobacterium RM2_2_10]
MTTDSEGEARLSIADSPDLLAKATAEALIAASGDLSLIGDNRQVTFRALGQRQFLRVRPFTDAYGLDWLILIVVPEQDFGAGLRTQVIWTAILGGLTLGIASAIGIAISRWLVRPIARFNQAASEIEAQAFDPESLDDIAARDDEVGEFARVFREMGLAIDDRQAMLDMQIRDLSDQESSAETKHEAVRQQLLRLRDRARDLQATLKTDGF